MKYAVDSEISKFIDNYTIEKLGVPSMVLMERAALSVAGKVAEVAVNFNHEVKIVAVCGVGNNGADGIAAARILTWQGLKVDIIIVGDENNATKEFIKQKEIALKSGMYFGNISNIGEYVIIIDAIFGVGLKRDIEGEFFKAIENINDANSYVVSVDIPSGIGADKGNIFNVAVKANSTVTFGYHKVGMLLYPGKEYAGEVTVADIGFSPKAVEEISPHMYFVQEDIGRIPKRMEYSNKGTYLRALIIAGNEDMSGAAYLSGAAAYRCGVGLVEIFTHINNTEVLKRNLPEAIVTGYDQNTASVLLEEKLKKADVIILGPGLGKSETSKSIVEQVIKYANVPLIIDADGLNIIAENKAMLKSYPSTVIITPHIGEMARLTGKNKDEIISDIIGTAKDFADEHNVICVLKDATTIVAKPQTESVYINNSGCGAMSKAGCGDVLTGVIAAMLALRLEPFSAAAMGVYIHGLAGEKAAVGINEHSLMASDLIYFLLN